MFYIRLVWINDDIIAWCARWLCYIPYYTEICSLLRMLPQNSLDMIQKMGYRRSLVDNRAPTIASRVSAYNLSLI